MNRLKSGNETRQTGIDCADQIVVAAPNTFLSFQKPILRMLCVCLTLAILLNGFAFAAEGVPACGMEEHVHTAACYAQELICGEEAREPVTETIRRFTADFKPHKHTKDCLDDAGNYVCGFVEGEYTHIHNSYCYDEDGRRVCGLEERKPHKHTDACYTERVDLTCGLHDPAASGKPSEGDPL